MLLSWPCADFPLSFKFHISGTIKKMQDTDTKHQLNLSYLYSQYLWFHSPAERIFWLMTVYVMIVSVSSGVRYNWASRSSNDITCVTMCKWINLSEPQVLHLKRRVNNKIHLLLGFLWGLHQWAQINYWPTLKTIVNSWWHMQVC